MYQLVSYIKVLLLEIKQVIVLCIFLYLLVTITVIVVKLEIPLESDFINLSYKSAPEVSMREMSFTTLTEEDRKRNEYLDKMNHAPYFTIVMISMGIVSLFTMFVLLGAF
ncbi:hypothetical protein RIVM261_056940 [Rivularia sp. IAM M-261]|nr:hypothetical protein RIVM261_056940 [Rivularia sp. IAM M-261]